MDRWMSDWMDLVGGGGWCLSAHMLGVYPPRKSPPPRAHSQQASLSWLGLLVGGKMVRLIDQVMLRTRFVFLNVILTNRPSKEQ